MNVCGEINYAWLFRKFMFSNFKIKEKFAFFTMNFNRVITSAEFQDKQLFLYSEDNREKYRPEHERFTKSSYIARPLVKYL